MTPATTIDETLVDTQDLLARLHLAVEFLAPMRDEAVGTERTRLASKIEGIQTCSRLVDKLGRAERFPGVEEVLELVRRVDPGTRGVTESLSEVELGISKGCRMVVSYVLNPGGKR